MKIYLLTLLAMTFILVSHAQDITFAGSAEVQPGPSFSGSETYAPTAYSSTAFLYRRARHPRNPKVKAGAIMAISGGGLALSGAMVMALLGSGDDEGPGNQTALYTGLGLFAAGGLLAIAGGIMVKVGHNEDRRIYGLHLVAPKPNEIGVAYSFR